MFHLLKKHFIEDKDLALILSCCYMLSGFTVASSQWLLYITGLTFIPLLLNFLFNLLKEPSLKNAILFAISYYLLLTNVYIGLLPLILFPVSLVIIKIQKNIQALALLFISLFFLILSFGHITPVRGWLNILPGISYFRNAGVLRVFFNLFFILYLATAF